jgi:ribonuclease P protein component
VVLPAAAVILTITRASDFTRVLNAPCRARTPHFAVHHLAQAPLPWVARRKAEEPTLSTPGQPELSTDDLVARSAPVDETPPTACWLGLVVPKKHAKRAVTRTLIKRRIRAAVQQAQPLDGGMWVVRLRSPFPRADFSSAASDQLALAASDELSSLMAAAVLPRRKARS